MFALDGEASMHLGVIDEDAVEIGSENDEAIPRVSFQSTDEQSRAWGR